MYALVWVGSARKKLGDSSSQTSMARDNSTLQGKGRCLLDLFLARSRDALGHGALQTFLEALSELDLPLRLQVVVKRLVGCQLFSRLRQDLRQVLDPSLAVEG